MSLIEPCAPPYTVSVKHVRSFSGLQVPFVAKRATSGQCVLGVIFTDTVIGMGYSLDIYERPPQIFTARGFSLNISF